MVIIRMWLYFPLRWFYGFLLILVLWIFITIYLGYSCFFFFFIVLEHLVINMGEVFLWLILHFLFLFSAILEVFIELSLMTTCDQYIEFSGRLFFHVLWFYFWLDFMFCQHITLTLKRTALLWSKSWTKNIHNTS